MKLTCLASLLVLLGACSAPSPLAGVLESSGPAPDRPADARLYDFLVGRWDLTVIGYGEDVARQESCGELAADFVLEGQAIQDVWISPPRGERGAGAPDPPVTGAFYGTMLRIYDPGLGDHAGGAACCTLAAFFSRYSRSAGFAVAAAAAA
jgi:hypothetical protein